MMSPASTHITPALRSFFRLVAIGALLVLALLLMAPAKAASQAAGASAHATASVTIERPAVIRSERLFETNRWIDTAGENTRPPAGQRERPCIEDSASAQCRLVIYDLP